MRTRTPDAFDALSVIGAMALVLAFLPLVMPASAGDRRNPATKQESSVADMCSRVLAQKWGVGSPINRVTVIPTDDLQEHDAVLGLVEFDRGYLGVYLAREDASKDSSLVIKKNDLPAFNECVVRLLSR